MEAHQVAPEGTSFAARSLLEVLSALSPLPLKEGWCRRGGAALRLTHAPVTALVDPLVLASNRNCSTFPQNGCVPSITKSGQLRGRPLQNLPLFSKKDKEPQMGSHPSARRSPLLRPPRDIFRGKHFRRTYSMERWNGPDPTMCTSKRQCEQVRGVFSMTRLRFAVRLERKWISLAASWIAPRVVLSFVT